MFYLEQNTFLPLIRESVERLDVDLSFSTQNYLNELLALYLKTENLFENNTPSDKKILKRVADIYMKFSLAEDKASLLKKIADHSLFLGGFLRAFVKQIVGINYYLDLGKNSYEHLATQYPSYPAYKELSDRFIDLADVLFYISSKSSVQNNQILLEFCKQYMETNCRVLACHLEDNGVCLSKENF